ncbi:MAG TPA: tetratricopeptide repeat protein [Candidatus Sulfotelmatobacter sp.]|nr:tetratricopeptide repeat protein [Candidatus Sulfotelmatobacter sp.]
MAHYELGLALQQSGKKDEAKQEFQKAADLDPHMPGPVR